MSNICLSQIIGEQVQLRGDILWPLQYIPIEIKLSISFSVTKTYKKNPVSCRLTILKFLGHVFGIAKIIYVRRISFLSYGRKCRSWIVSVFLNVSLPMVFCTAQTTSLANKNNAKWKKIACPMNNWKRFWKTVHQLSWAFLRSPGSDISFFLLLRFIAILIRFIELCRFIKLLSRYIEIIMVIYRHITAFYRIIISIYRHIIAFCRIIMSSYRIIIAIYRNNDSDISTYCVLSK